MRASLTRDEGEPDLWQSISWITLDCLALSVDRGERECYGQARVKRSGETASRAKSEQRSFGNGRGLDSMQFILIFSCRSPLQAVESVSSKGGSKPPNSTTTLSLPTTSYNLFDLSRTRSRPLSPSLRRIPARPQPAPRPRHLCDTRTTSRPRRHGSHFQPASDSNRYASASSQHTPAHLIAILTHTLR